VYDQVTLLIGDQSQHIASRGARGNIKLSKRRKSGLVPQHA
jgi:hypothetical protein